MGFIEFFVSPIFGTIIGSISAAWTRREERKMREVELAHEKDMANINSQIRINEAKVEGEVTVQKYDAQAFKESQKTSSPWADTIRMAVRPLLTGYLVWVCSYLGFELNSLVGGLESLPASDLMVMYKDVIMSVMTLTSMAVSWWFGSRNTQANKK